MKNHLFAPFDKETISILRKYQEGNIFHPYTCVNNHEGDRILWVDEDGFYCQNCDYKQNWCNYIVIDMVRAGSDRM